MRVPVVFDNLIAKHDLPPMIGIFVDPGILPVVATRRNRDDQNRYNRIYEYDSLTPRFAEFLLNELIPEVAKNYNLSKNPDDRGLSGVSTGAVGAFMAAWNRPDQFHRVLSFIGTYVSMKGADALPALVRKTEPKPIRIFMQDGTNDHIVPAEPYGTSFAGSWPINNQVMYQALEFAGYDVKLVMGTEAHNMKQGGAIMPDALRWLWRGYPEPIVVHEPAAMHDPDGTRRDKVFSTIYRRQALAADRRRLRSIIAASPPTAMAMFISPIRTRNASIAWIADGKMTQFTEPPNDAIHRAHGRGRSALHLPADRPETSSLPTRSTGKASGEKTDRQGPRRRGGLCRHAKRRDLFSRWPDGHASASSMPSRPRRATLRIASWTDLDGEMTSPKGLALSPDQSMLVVSDADFPLQLVVPDRGRWFAQKRRAFLPAGNAGDDELAWQRRHARRSGRCRWSGLFRHAAGHSDLHGKRPRRGDPEPAHARRLAADRDHLCCQRRRRTGSTSRKTASFTAGR